jgi:glycerol-3-phosphate acyltransferase PlsY
MDYGLQIIINCILSYLIGSISGSMVLGNLKGIDIRKMGSGNAGGTNAFRTVGPFFALGVIIIDILKGYISVIYISQLNFMNYSIIGLNEIMNITCGISAVLGHVYPLYYNFKGGKGAGTLIGIIAALFPFKSLMYAILSWIIILIFTGYVGLGTIIAGITLALNAYVIFVGTEFSEYIYFAFLMAIFIIFTHRENILRMLNGNENKFEKIMIFKKFSK